MTIDTTEVDHDQSSGSNTVVSKSQALRLIPEGENFSPGEVWEGDQCTATFAVRRVRNGPRYEKVVTFDFSGVTREQLLELSMYHVKVWTQRVLRATKQEDMLNPNTLSTVAVLQDIVHGVRRSGDPVGAAFRTLARQFGITEDKAREIFAGVVDNKEEDNQ